MNNLPKASAKATILSLLVIILTCIACIYAIFFIEERWTALNLFLLSYTVLRIVTDYDSPFSLKPEITVYALDIVIMGFIILSDTALVSVLAFICMMLALKLIIEPMYNREINKSIEKAMQTKKKEDALIALLQLKKRGLLREDNDVHQALLTIYNQEVM